MLGQTRSVSTPSVIHLPSRSNPSPTSLSTLLVEAHHMWRTTTYSELLSCPPLVPHRSSLHTVPRKILPYKANSITLLFCLKTFCSFLLLWKMFKFSSWVWSCSLPPTSTQSVQILFTRLLLGSGSVVCCRFLWKQIREKVHMEMSYQGGVSMKVVRQPASRQGEGRDPGSEQLLPQSHRG